MRRLLPRVLLVERRNRFSSALAVCTGACALGVEFTRTMVSTAGADVGTAVMHTAINATVAMVQKSDLRGGHAGKTACAVRCFAI